MDFDPPHVHEANGTVFKTFNFVLRGSFPDILRTIHTLELQSSFGEVTHIDFVKQKKLSDSQKLLGSHRFYPKIRVNQLCYSGIL